MAIIVDIYGTKSVKFGVYDSDLGGLYVKDDKVIRDGIVYRATSDIPAGTPFTVADSELQENAWYKEVVGVNSPEAIAGDSELWAAIQNLKLEYDSDNIITRNDHDSDTLMTYHDFRAADSDLIIAFTDADSDQTLQQHHDVDIKYIEDFAPYNATDIVITDAVTSSTLRPDLNINGVYSPRVSNTHVFLDNDGDWKSNTASTRLQWYNADQNITLTQDLNWVWRFFAGDLTAANYPGGTVVNSEVFDSESLRDAFRGVITYGVSSSTTGVSLPSNTLDTTVYGAGNQITLIGDLVVSNGDSIKYDISTKKWVKATFADNADIRRLLDSETHDRKAKDSDIVILLRNTIDSDIARIYHDYRASDSDFRVDYDSDIPQLYHDYQAADSDIRTLLQDTIDSDIARIYHDYQAADSDIIVTVTGGLTLDLDSEIHERKANDSEIRLLIDHNHLANDSDNLVSRLNDVIINTGGFKDSDYASLNVTGSTYTPINGDWETHFSNVALLETGVNEIPHVFDVNDKHLYFRKNISGSRWFILAPVYNSSNVFVEWKIYDTSPNDSEGIFLSQTVTGDVPLVGPSTNQTLVTQSSYTNDQYNLLETATFFSGTFNITRNVKMSFPVLADGYALTWDSDNQVWTAKFSADANKLRIDMDSEIAKVRHDFSAEDSDLQHFVTERDSEFNVRILELEDYVAGAASATGKFSVNDSEALTLPPEPGFTQWTLSSINSTFNTTAFQLQAFTSRGFIYLPLLPGSGRFGVFGYQCYSGTTLPPDTLVPTNNPKKGVYTIKSENRIFVYDDSIGLTKWEEIFLGERVRLTAAATDSIISSNNSTNPHIAFFYQVPDSDNGNTVGGMWVRRYFFPGNINQSWTTIPIVNDSDDVASIWNPPSLGLGGAQQSSFPVSYIAYVKNAQKLAFVGDAIGLFPDNTWQFYNANLAIVEPNNKPSDHLKIYRDTYAWEDGSTFWDRINKKLYVRENNQSNKGWEEVTSGLTRADYDSDILDVKAMILQKDSDQRLSDLIDVSFDSDLLEHGQKLIWDSDLLKWTAKFTNDTSSTPIVERFTVSGPDDSEFSLARYPVGDVMVVRNGIVLRKEAYTVDYTNRKVNYKGTGNLNDLTLDSEDDIQIHYQWASVNENNRLGDLLDVDPDLLTPLHSEVLMWDSDSETWKGGVLNQSTLITDTFIADSDQRSFLLNSPVVGQPTFSRNGSVLPASCITLSVDGRTCLYDPAFNENSIIDSDDIITITYLTGYFPIGWPPAALANLPDINVVGRTNGSIVYYDQNDALYKHIDDTDRTDGDLLEWHQDSEAHGYTTKVGRTNGNLLQWNNTTKRHEYTTATQRNNGSLLQWNDTTNKHEYTTATQRNDGNLLQWNATTNKHEYTTDSDKEHGAQLVWDVNENRYKHLSRKSLSVQGQGSWGTGSFTYWDSESGLGEWKAVAEPPQIRTTLFGVNNYKLVWNNVDERVDYFPQEEFLLYFNQSTNSGITAGSWISLNAPSVSDATSVTNTAGHFRNGAPNFGDAFAPNALDIGNGTWEIEYCINKIIPTGGQTWTYLNWEVATFSASPVVLHSGGEIWTYGAEAGGGVPSTASGNGAPIKFAFRPDMSTTPDQRRFRLRCNAAASSASATSANFRISGYVRVKRVLI